MTLPSGANKRLLLAAISTVVLVSLGSYAAVAAGKPGPRPERDAALTGEQRTAADQKVQQDFQHRYAEWLTSPAAQGQDLRRLERRTIAASYLPGQPTLDAAKRKADVVVTGLVSGITFEPGKTFITFRVERPLKGQPANDLVVMQGGGLSPAPDFQHAYLVVDESSPPLLPGDRAALLLQRTGGSGEAFIVQPFSGEYVLVDGRVRSTPGNPFGGTVDGQAEDEFLSRLAG